MDIDRVKELRESLLSIIDEAIDAVIDGRIELHPQLVEHDGQERPQVPPLEDTTLQHLLKHVLRRLQANGHDLGDSGVAAVFEVAAERLRRARDEQHEVAEQIAFQWAPWIDDAYFHAAWPEFPPARGRGRPSTKLSVAMFLHAAYEVACETAPRLTYIDFIRQNYESLVVKPGSPLSGYLGKIDDASGADEDRQRRLAEMVGFGAKVARAVDAAMDEGFGLVMQERTANNPEE